MTYRFSVVPRGPTALVHPTYDGELFARGLSLDGAKEGKKARKSP